MDGPLDVLRVARSKVAELEADKDPLLDWHREGLNAGDAQSAPAFEQGDGGDQNRNDRGRGDQDVRQRRSRGWRLVQQLSPLGFIPSPALPRGAVLGGMVALPT